MSLRMTTIAAALALALPYTASGDEHADHAFLQDAVRSNLAEIELGELAQQKSESDAVQDFAAMLVEDHGDALEKARELAEENGFSIPSEPTPEQRMTYERLSQLDGQRFDREWLGLMVQNHEKGVAKFRAHAEMDDDSEVVSYAEELLPTLEGHLRQAERLEGDELQSRARQ